MRARVAALDCTELFTSSTRRRERGVILSQGEIGRASTMAFKMATSEPWAGRIRSLTLIEPVLPTLLCDAPADRSRRAGSALHDLLVQLLVDDLDGAIDLGIGLAELVRDQFYEEIDALDEGRAGGNRAGGG
jgi:hypothetical protein